VESSCELGNEPSGSIKCWETIERLHNLWPLECYSAPQLVVGLLIQGSVISGSNLYRYLTIDLLQLHRAFLGHVAESPDY
jgi:hypothetical protein